MYNIYTEKPVSKRGQAWLKFASKVLQHIEEYTVPQYGDEGEDIATDYKVEDSLNGAKKYIARFGRNARDGEQFRDFLKAAHYIQMAFTTWLKGTSTDETASN